MMRFAICQEGSGAIRSILMAADLESLALNIPEGCTARICEDTQVLPDTHRYDAAAGAFVAAPIVEPFEPFVAVTRLGYQRRFTQAERIAVRGSADPIVIDFRELAAMAEEIDLADPDVIAGTGYLEMLGLIGAGRAAEILNASAG